MKKISNLSESNFLKLFFAFASCVSLIAAVCMPDRAEMFSGLWQIVSQPSKLSTNYFALGGYAGTFLNMGLLGFACLALFIVFKGTPNNVATLAFFLTQSFGTWGINILNMWPSVFGVMLYGLVKKEKLGTLVNAMLFSTGIAPLVTDMMIRYPNADVVGFNIAGIILSLFAGAAIGFFLPTGLAHSPKVHKGFTLYSAALPIGVTAFFLNATFYKTMGVALPAGADAAQLQVASQSIANIFYLILFGSSVVLALVMGCRPKDYWKLVSSKEQVASITGTYGNAMMLMNFGVFGLVVLGYYNLIGASFNGVTVGVILCTVCTCNSSAHPGNIWPTMLGYVVASTVCGWLSTLVGGTFSLAVNAQAICVGFCYACGLCPIKDKYGWQFSFIAAMMHYMLVTSVPNIHGGFCLYNGGFTTIFICILFIPILERFAHTKEERKALKAN